MSVIRIKGDKAKYNVLDRNCIGRECLALSHFQSRGATLSGSRNTGNSQACCVHRAYHGCPTPIPLPTEELIKQRKKEGMRFE